MSLAAYMGNLEFEPGGEQHISWWLDGHFGQPLDMQTCKHCAKSRHYRYVLVLLTSPPLFPNKLLVTTITHIAGAK